tara:strand:- start:2563 stop:4065 length:1503 start_codon:yes stop_codon:yes gene_type:complete
MKLVRLTSREPTAFFDASFNDEIIIPANSQIALQSATVNVTASEIIIDGQNGEITVQIADGISRTINLDPNIYNTNIAELYSDIQNKLNDAMNYVSTEPSNKVLGIEWSAKEDKNRETTIEYKIGQFGEYQAQWSYNTTYVQRQNVAGRGFWGQVATRPVQTANESNMVFPSFISRGNGFIRCRTGTLEENGSGDEDEQGYLLALTDAGITSSNEPYLTQAQITFGLRVIMNAGVRFYEPIINGNTNPAVTMDSYTANAATNEFQEITINGSTVEINIYRTDGTKVTLGSADYTAGQKLNAVIAFRGQRADCTIDQVRITPSPFSDVSMVANAVGIGDQGTPSAVGSPPAPRPARITNNSLFFGSIDLANFLGFENRANPIIGFLEAAEASYTSERAVYLAQEADAFIVELMNLQVDSYDSFSVDEFPAGGQRRNILSVIPSSNVTGTIAYEPPYPTFLDLGNAEPITLRNIKARVLRNDNTPVAKTGVGSLVLLFETKK